MNMIAKCLFTSLFFFLLWGVNQQVCGQSGTKTADITVSDGIITINGVNFTEKDGCTISTFQSALGKATRTKEGYNRLHTYDNLGIVLFESTSNHLVNEIQFFTTADNTLDFCPKSLFTGTLKIEKLDINASTKLKKAKKKMKKYQLKKSSLSDNSYRGEYKYIYVFLTFNDNNSGIKKISLGLKDK